MLTVKSNGQDQEYSHQWILFPQLHYRRFIFSSIFDFIVIVALYVAMIFIPSFDPSRFLKRKYDLVVIYIMESSKYHDHIDLTNNITKKETWPNNCQLFLWDSWSQFRNFWFCPPRTFWSIYFCKIFEVILPWSNCINSNTSVNSFRILI